METEIISVNKTAIRQLLDDLSCYISMGDRQMAEEMLDKLHRELEIA